MADAIDNLAQDLNQANPSVDAMYPLGYENYYIPRPDDFGVPQELNQTGDRWIWDARNPQWGYYKYAQNLSNPSTLGTGTEIDFNTPDDPTIRTNIGNTDEQDAFVRTGIGTTLDPLTEQRYNTTGTTPSPVGGVEYLTPKQIEDLTAGQTPSVPQGVVTRGEPVSIPGRTIPDYIPIGQMENGDVLYADRNNIRDTIIRPSAYSVSQEDLDKGVVPQKFNFGVNSVPSTSQVTPTSVGATEPTTTSVGGFDNTGGDVTAGPGGVKDITPDWKEDAKPKPGDEIDDSPWEVFDPTGKGKDDSDYRDPKTGDLFLTDQYGYKWNYRTGQFDCVGGRCSEKPPGEDTPKPPVVTPPVVTTPPGGGTTTTPPGGTTTPPGGGTTTTPPGGGVRPGTGTGTGTYTGTPLPTREPVTPLVRRETVIPTKGTKEVPLPDRQADPFAKLYADLLANSQQQQDQYRYINYDPDQIMNAAMSGFRRRGAMRSLQG
jgi:hypothetical protein